MTQGAIIHKIVPQRAPKKSRKSPALGITIANMTVKILKITL